MKNWKTTLAGALVGFGTLALLIAHFLQGQPFDFSTAGKALIGIAIAFGLYKAADAPPSPPALPRGSVRISLLAPVAALSLVLVLVAGCQPPERTTRDSIALLHGYLAAAQAQHPECSPVSHPENQAQVQCQVIARGIGAQNTAIDALEVYCSGPGFNAGAGPCEPPKKGSPAWQTATAKLSAAVAGMNQAQGDVKQLLGVK